MHFFVRRTVSTKFIKLCMMTPYWCPLHMIVNVKLSMQEKSKILVSNRVKVSGLGYCTKQTRRKVSIMSESHFSLMGNLHKNKTHNVVRLFSLDCISEETSWATVTCLAMVWPLTLRCSKKSLKDYVVRLYGRISKISFRRLH